MVLAIALSGLVPLLVMQSRQQKRLEGRLGPARTYYLAPSPDPWARKLGAGAALALTPPAPLPPPPILVLDNADAGYSEQGSGWTAEARSDAYCGGNRYHAAGTGANTASFLFTGLQPGWYQVWATWSPGSDRARNAPFTVRDGAVVRGTFLVKQQVPPRDGVYGDRPWDCLGLAPLDGTTLEVVLSDQADGRVIADGVRLVPVRNTVRVQSLQRTLTGETVSAGVSLTVVTP